MSAFFFILTLSAYAAYVSKNGREWSAVPGESNVQSPEPGPRRTTHHAPRLVCHAYASRITHPLLSVVLVCLVADVVRAGPDEQADARHLRRVLLLDYWPLRRFGFPPQRLNYLKPEPAETEHATRSTQPPFPWHPTESIPRLLLEKLPSSRLPLLPVSSRFGRNGAEGRLTLAAVPLEFRMSNALRACGFYLQKTFWPGDLAVFYRCRSPFPGGRSRWRFW